MRSWLGGILLTALAAAVACGDAGHEEAPLAGLNSSAGNDASLPGPYRVLLTRSIFAANGKSGDTAGASEGGAPTAPSLALKGVVQDDQQFTAFVEDVPQKRVLELKVGDSVANGRVVAITLHELKYEAAGRLIRVAIGEGLGDWAGPTTAPAGAPPAEPTVAARPHPRHPSSVAEAR